MDDLNSRLDEVQYFGGKVPLASAHFQQIESKYKKLAFTIPGYTKVDLLKAFQNYINKISQIKIPIKFGN